MTSKDFVVIKYVEGVKNVKMGYLSIIQDGKEIKIYNQNVIDILLPYIGKEWKGW